MIKGSETTTEVEYQVVLRRPITAGGVTIIRHRGSGGYVSYTSHPANVNGDSAAVPADILDLIDNLNGIIVPPLTMYQCDIVHSNECAPADILGEIDLLNGAGEWDVWNGSPRPASTGCPAPPA